MFQLSPILETYYDKNNKWTVFEILSIGLATTFVAWYIQWHWSRRYLYKLASKIHGPRPLPFIGSALYFLGSPTFIYENVMGLFRDYPKILAVWFGHRLFFGVQHPPDLEIIMNSPKALAKDVLYEYSEHLVGHGLFSAPVATWKRHRKVISPTFNQRILDNFVEIFSEQSVILNEQLEKFAGKGTFDLFHTVTNCTLDIICETAMGIKVNAQTSNTQVGIWIDKLMEIMFLRMFVLTYHFDIIFNRSIYAKIQNDLRDKVKEFSGKVVREKRAAFEKKMQEKEEYCEESNTKRKAFLDYLLELSHEGAKFTDQELNEEVITFIVAGSDTTATSNSFTLVCLGMHQDVQEKVYNEAIEVLGTDRMVTAEDLPKLKYTERVIKECLRLFPVGAFIVRAVEEDIQLSDYTLPGGSSIVVGIHAVHKNPEIWPNPNKFDPDRFLPEEVAKRHPYAYIPFSAGPRNCIGPRYAMMAMKSVIATVIRKYKIYTDYKSIEDIKLKTNIVLRPCDGFKVSLELRK